MWRSLGGCTSFLFHQNPTPEKGQSLFGFLEQKTSW